MQYRIEKDSMGEIKVPADVLWGAQTERSYENFKIGHETIPKEIIKAIAIIKKAAAKVNGDAKKIAPEISQAIQRAADIVISGEVDDQFPLKVWQTGSGTQTNMNVNEVIAHLVKRENSLIVHPNDDVNKCQSSNDVFPSAIHIAGVLLITSKLLPVLDEIITTLNQLAEQNKNILKVGRTHLQDATPISFGQEISGWQQMMVQGRDMLVSSLNYLYQLPIGGTAVGTGLNTFPTYSHDIVSCLVQETKINFVEDVNKFHGLSSKDSVVFVHGALKALAANAMKMANDIRWLASGPRSGLGEIQIPANEPGSSIMPGKVNPTQCEALTMIAIQVMSNDTGIGIAASQGNFELNVYMPVIAYQLIQSINLLSDGLHSFNQNCLIGLKANQDRMENLLDSSLMLVTALNPHIGYDNAAKIAKTAFQNQQTLKEAALASGLVTAEEYDKWVVPKQMVYGKI